MQLFIRRILSIVALMIIGQFSYSQDQNTLPKSFIPPSPNAANLGLYSAIPVDIYTGVPKIDITLHTFKINGLDLTINLAYHAGGIRQADEASWVGLGWSLNSGGIISRTKRGKDDFSQYGFYKVNPANRPCDNTYDQEPDLFFFNFAGQIGKFMLDYNAGSPTPKIIPLVKNAFLINFTPTGGWKVTDEKGIIYEFEAKEQTTDIYDPSVGVTETEIYTSTWYLSKITNQFGEALHFTYTNTGNKIYKKITTHSTRNLTDWWPADLFSVFTFFGDKNGLAYHAEISQPVKRVSTNETMTEEILLQRITSEYDLVEFVIGNRVDLTMQSAGMIGKKLDRIDIKSSGYNGRPYEELLKSYEFTYDYFNSLSGQPDNIAKRLQLKSIQEVSGSVNVAPFNFFYNANQLPDKINTLNVGGFITNITEGLLSKMVYPTGGHANFEYEPHFGNLGVRVKKTEQVDFTGIYNIRTYEYIGGKKLGLSTPFSSSVQDQTIPYERQGHSGMLFGTLVFTTTFAADEFMMGESSGNYLVGYDQVNELHGVSGQLGKTVYYFKNQQSVPVNWVPADVPQDNGFLTKQEEYAYANGNYVRIKMSEKFPEVINITSVQCKRKFVQSCDYPYTMKMDWVKLIKETETTFDQYGNNPVINESVYTYGNPLHIFPTTKQFTDSKGDIWVTQNKYTQEKSVEIGGVYTKMLQKNMHVLIEKNTQMNGIQIAKNKTNYKDWYLDGKMIMPETEEHQKGNNSSEIKIRYYEYNNQGRPVQMSKEDDLRMSYIWGYRGLMPIAEIKHANVGDFSELLTKNYNLALSIPVQESPLETVNVIYIDHLQTVQLAGQIAHVSGLINSLEEFHLIIKDASDGTEILNRHYFYFPQNISENISLPRGAYYVYYSFDANSGENPPVQLALSLTVNLKEYHVVPNYFYTSFEEYSSFPSTPLTGVNVHLGTFSVPMPAISGKYKLSWWEKPQNGGVWTFKQQLITITGTSTPSVTIGALGYIIDEVRMHAADALMTTYTYDPQKGMTSKTDERNRITYYEYDALGRLKFIRDQEKNIVKSFEYKYQEQQ